jgi:hypothetical protein
MNLNINSDMDFIKELGLNITSQLAKYILTHRNIKKQDLLAHHYNIAFNAFRNWFQEIKLSGIQVTVKGRGALLWKMYSGQVEYKSHNQSLIKRLGEPQIEEIKQTIEHLEDGYPALWTIWHLARDEANTLLEEVRDFWNDIEERFVYELEQRDPKLPVLTEWNDHESFQTNFYLLEDTVENIFKEIQNIFIHKVSATNFFKLSNESRANFIVGTSAQLFMRTNNKSMAEKFAKLADDLIHDSEFVIRAEKIESRKSEIEGKLKIFNDSLYDISKGLEEGNRQLEGRCWVCKRIMNIL